MKIATRFLPIVFMVGVLALPQPVFACAACFGRSDSPMARGMNMGILSLLLVVMGVLAAIASFFIYLMIRSARLAAAAAASSPFPPTPAQSTH